jgi:hypothetical protein
MTWFTNTFTRFLWELTVLHPKNKALKSLLNWMMDLDTLFKPIQSAFKERFAGFLTGCQQKCDVFLSFSPKLLRKYILAHGQFGLEANKLPRPLYLNLLRCTEMCPEQLLYRQQLTPAQTISFSAPIFSYKLR